MLIPNMESILENFELFKRKHISQNREIIKANAMAQLRMRELENRVQTLEAEKVDKEAEALGLIAEVNQLRHALASVYEGWEAIGRGLSLIPAPSFAPPDLIKVGLGSPLPESKRVAIDPPLPPSILVRAIAKAPEGHIDSLHEENLKSGDSKQSRFVIATFDQAPTAHSRFDGWQLQATQATQSPRTREVGSYTSTDSVTSLLSMDEAPSPLGSPKPPMAFEGVIATSQSAAQPWSPSNAATEVQMASGSSYFDQHNVSGHQRSSHTSDRQQLRRSGRKSSRRQSGYIPYVDLDPPSEPDLNRSTPAPSSDPYLPSDTNSETMEGVLVYRGSETTSSSFERSRHRLKTQAPLADITNVELDPFSGPPGLGLHLDDHAAFAEQTPRKSRDAVGASHFDHNGLSFSSRRSGTRSPSLRKRKSILNGPQDPIPTPARLFSADIEATSQNVNAEAESEPQTGRTRRVRKSINYALPKLNTKMRKPDPSDLIPASTPRRSNINTPSSARGMVGSTGNLSDIRKLHEAAALRQQSPAERASDRRCKGSIGSGNDETTVAEHSSSVRLPDLFQLEHHAERLASGQARQPFSGETGTDTSDDESRVTSNADLGELADLEAALGELCTMDEAPRQVDTPRLPPSSIWPSYSSGPLPTGTTSSRTSSATSSGSATNDPAMRRKPTPAPARSRQASAEGVLASAELVNGRAASASAGLAGGMRPKQRPGSAGAALASARTANGHSSSGSSGDRPRTFSGTTATKAGLLRSAASNGSLDNVARSAPATSSQRASLHSALTDQQRPKAVRQYVSVHSAAKAIPHQ